MKKTILLITLLALLPLNLVMAKEAVATITINKDAFNSITGEVVINYYLEEVENAEVKVIIENSEGYQVKVFNEGIKNSGNHSLLWDGKDENGTSATEGIHTIKLEVYKEGNITYEFEKSWGVLGLGNGQFNHPQGVAVDANGDVYVADTINRRIQKFDADGNFLNKFICFPYMMPARFGECWYYNEPFGLDVDENGNIVVADTRRHNVVRVDENGLNTMSLGSSYWNHGNNNSQFHFPHDVATDRYGNIYVADTYNHRIQKFNSNGVFILKWGNQSSDGDGQFRYPEGITVDSSGNIYVADTYNHRIQKFNSNGNFIMKWGSYGTEDNQLKYPRGIDVDRDGNVFVADYHNVVIKKFDSNGNFITKWGGSGSEEGKFSSLWDMAVTESGSIYVADSGNNRIQKFIPVIKNEVALSEEITVIIDKTAPEIKINSPENRNYLLNEKVNADWVVSDNLSGMFSVWATSNNGQAIDTSNVGEKIFEVSAIDKAGNQSKKEIKYKVSYDFSGFLSPLDKERKGKGNIAVKFSLRDAEGSAINNTIAQLYIAKIESGEWVEFEAISNGKANEGNYFKCKNESGEYIYHLNKDVISPNIKLIIKLDDGMEYIKDL